MIQTEIEKLTGILSSIKTGFVMNEADLALLVEQALSAQGIVFVREARITGGRADFLTQSGILIEVKKAKATKTAIQQLTRYAADAHVNAMILYARNKLRLPTEIAGKPVFSVGYFTSWGIAIDT